jgi:DNA ligase-associated metallophosphoesterase
LFALRFLGLDWQLHSSGAAFLPQASLLLVADAHFGKAVSFRRLGVPVPEGTTAANLASLDALILQTGARQVVFLGDFLHSAAAHAPVTQQALASWRAQNPELALTLVRGNHDDHAGDPPAALQIKVVDEPLRLQLGGQTLAFCHHPQPVDGAYVLAGHWHPCVSVSGAGRDRLRLPCFWLGDPARHAVGILPAFGAFTGKHPIQRRPGDRVFVMAGDVLRELPGF